MIDAFFEYGKLKSIPAQQKKRRIVLEVIAEQFAYGKTYPEQEVNLIIAGFHDDFCTIRRDMIGEHLLERDASGYRRVKPTGRKRALEQTGGARDFLNKPEGSMPQKKIQIV